ncbi:hypothetical protein BJ138DRAFT_982075, partial [Hygrophoropsis aurantiaca]
VPRPPIVINQQTIQPMTAHKFLGIILDQELRFKEQATHAIEKGTKYVLASRRMTKPSRGVKMGMMKRLYGAVVI